MKAKLFLFASLGALAAVAAACSSSSTVGTTGGSGGASSDQVASCKQSCDKMKFFECNSAAEQARCYDDCNAATSDQIQLFTACANNSVCDPACRTNITPKPSSGQPAAGGTGASAATCTSACQKLVQCSYVRVGDEPACEAQCTKSAYQYQIDCVNNTSCDKLASTCGTPTGSTTGGGTGTDDAGGGGADDFEVLRCQSSCDTLSTFACINATDHAKCRSLCATATAGDRDSFRTCADGAAPDCTRATDCWTTFEGQ